jgi:four helix bundle protein
MAFRDFTVKPIWQKGLALLIEIYQVTKTFPDEERYGMVSDMRRAANSIIHNFAEGFGRFENRDKSRFYKISRGSAYEIISQTFASYHLAYITTSKKEELIHRCMEIIDEEDLLIKSVESRKGNPSHSPQP